MRLIRRWEQKRFSSRPGARREHGRNVSRGCASVLILWTFPITVLPFSPLLACLKASVHMSVVSMQPIQRCSARQGFLLPLSKRVTVEAQKLAKFGFASTSMNSLPPQEAVPAAFTDGLEHQVAHFRKYGFVAVKGPQSAADISKLHAETLGFFETHKRTWKYRFWRFWHKVSTAKNRHSIPLVPNELILNVLNSTIGRNRHLLEEFLPANSPCVELSGMISLPGSERQITHSDIAFTPHDLVITGFVALSDVTFESGPTHLHPGSHTSAFHRQCTNAYSTRRLPSYDGWDADFLEMPAELSPFPETETAEATTAAEEAQRSPPVYAALQAGDMLLFDTKIFHYGSANESELPRALLAFSFQRSDCFGRAGRIEGFTYHVHRKARGKFVLSSFNA